MDLKELKACFDGAPLADRAVLNKLYHYLTIGDDIKGEYADALANAGTYQELLEAIYEDASQKDTLVWAEIAKFKRKNWLVYFEPEICIQNLRMKTDGLPIQMGTGVILAPTGSRDNIANLYVFKNGAFNRSAAEFVTSVAGGFTIADIEFLGIYGLYRYRGNVILEEWEQEAPPKRTASA